MLVRALTRGKKNIVVPGKWQDGGTRGMPKSAFPLSKTRSFQLGRKWRWRVDVLDYQGAELRLLTAFEPSTERFLGWLSIRRWEDYAIVARYEFHGDEPGWHAHSVCGHAAQVPVAQVKPYGTRRLPAARASHRRQEYDVTEARALAITFKVFRVQPASQGGGLL